MYYWYFRRSLDVLYVIKSIVNVNKDCIVKYVLMVLFCYENNSNIGVVIGGLVNCKVVYINCNKFFFVC